MRRIFETDDTGNGVVEMLLFSPLAVLFLFAATDLALALKDRSAVTEAIRSALVGHPRFVDQTTGDASDSDELVKRTAAMIEDNISQARGGTRGKQEVYIEAALLSFEVDIDTGEPVSERYDGTFFKSGVEHSHHCRGEDLRDSLSPRLSKELIRGTMLRSVAGGSFRYLPHAHLLVARVCTLAHGVTGSGVAALFGKSYAFDSVQVVPFRMPGVEQWSH